MCIREHWGTVPPDRGTMTLDCGNASRDSANKQMYNENTVNLCKYISI